MYLGKFYNWESIRVNRGSEWSREYALPPTKTKADFTWIWLRCTPFCGQEPFWVELEWVAVNSWVVQTFPAPKLAFHQTRVKESTYQTFGITNAPLGMKYPSWISSWITLCGTATSNSINFWTSEARGNSPVGTAACHRKTSRTRALMYGRWGRSSKVGSLSLPTTASISACAALVTSGWRVRPKKSE